MKDNENNKLPMVQNGANLARKAENAAFEEFVLWWAMPPHEKRRLGLETQEAYAEYTGLHRNTTSRWKKSPAFYPRLKEIRDLWAKDRTQDVIAALYRGAISNGIGAPKDRELWFKYVEGWNEKTQVEHTQKVEVTIRDIRFMINAFPLDLQQKFYGYLNEINNAATLLRRSGQFIDGVLPEPTAEGEILDDTDHDAQGAPRPSADALAESYQSCIRGDLEWQAQPCDYQSATRWW